MAREVEGGQALTKVPTPAPVMSPSAFVPQVPVFQAPNVTLPDPYQTQGQAPAPYQIQGQQPAPYQIQGQQPTAYQPTAMPSFNTPASPAPMTMTDLLGIQKQLPNYQVSGFQAPTYQGQAPQYIAPPQYGDFQKMMTQYGLLPDLNNPQSVASFNQTPSFGGASYTPVNTSLPNYAPTASIEDRVKAYLDMQYGGTENLLGKAKTDLGTEYGIQKASQEGFGQQGDAKLAALYQQLGINVGQHGQQIGQLYDTAQQGIGNAYDQATGAVTDFGNTANSNLSALAQQLGLGQALPAGAATLADHQQQQLGNLQANKASTLGLNESLQAGMQAANQRDVSNAATMGTNKRSDLQSIVGGNLGQLQRDYNVGLGDITQQQTNLSQERGAAAVDKTGTLEDQAYQRLYQKALDEAGLGIENSKLGLQASSINQAGQIAGAQLQFQKQQAMADALTKTQEFGMRNSELQYSSAKDYQNAMQDFFQNTFQNNMASQGMNLDVSKFNAQMGQQNFQNTLATGAFLGDQNQQNFVNGMDMSKFNASNFFNNEDLGLRSNANAFNQYIGGNELGLKANQNAFSQFIDGNQLGLAANANGLSNFLGVNSQGLAQNANAFGQGQTQIENGMQGQQLAMQGQQQIHNQNIDNRNYGLDLQKFKADSDPNTPRNQQILQSITSSVQAGKLDEAKYQLDLWKTGIDAANVPQQARLLEAQIASAQASANANNAQATTYPSQIAQNTAAANASTELANYRVAQATKLLQGGSNLPKPGTGLAYVPAALTQMGMSAGDAAAMQAAMAAARQNGITSLGAAVANPQPNPNNPLLPLPNPSLQSYITGYMQDKYPNMDPIMVQVALQIMGTK